MYWPNRSGKKANTRTSMRKYVWHWKVYCIMSFNYFRRGSLAPWCVHYRLQSKELFPWWITKNPFSAAHIKLSIHNSRMFIPIRDGFFLHFLFCFHLFWAFWASGTKVGKIGNLLISQQKSKWRLITIFPRFLTFSPTCHQSFRRRTCTKPLTGRSGEQSVGILISL